MVRKMVKIEILEETEESIKLLLSETDRSMANALRRSLITDVPKMAIDEVRFQLGTKRKKVRFGRQQARFPMRW